MGEFGEPGGVTERLLKIAHGGEDLDQMFREADQLKALRGKFKVDSPALEEKISSVSKTLNLDRQNAIRFLMEVKLL